MPITTSGSTWKRWLSLYLPAYHLSVSKIGILHSPGFQNPDKSQTGVPLVALSVIEGNPDNLPSNRGDLINFEKRRMMFDIIDRMRQWQVIPYNLQTVPAIQKYIEESLLPFGDSRESSERFWALSMEIEPSESGEERIPQLFSLKDRLFR